MTRQELELKAKEFDSKLNRHPMSSEELQEVLCDFVEALRIHDVVGRSKQLPILDRCGCDEPNEEPIKICMNCNGYVE